MYGRNSLFPAYTGLDQVDVRLPHTNRASHLSRNAQDLRAIYDEEPHVVVNADPGLRVPLPDNGFDPRGLGETSPENQLFNRGSAQILTENARTEIRALLQENFLQEFSENDSFVGMTPSSIREELYKTNPGALLLYNGASIEKLRTADALVNAVLTSAKVWADQIGVEAIPRKEQFLNYIKACAVIRLVAAREDSYLRQQTLSNSQKVNELDNALLLLDLSLPPELESDSSLRDHTLCVNLATNNLQLALYEEALVSGLSETLEHVCQFICSLTDKGELGYYYKKFKHAVRSCLADRLSASTEALSRLQNTLERDLSSAGVDTTKIKDLAAGQSKLEQANKTSQSLRAVWSKEDAPYLKDTVPELQEAVSAVKDALLAVSKSDARKKGSGGNYVGSMLEGMALREALSLISELLEDKNPNVIKDAEVFCNEVESMLLESKVPKIERLKKMVSVEIQDKQAAENKALDESVKAALDASTISEKEVSALKLLS